MTFPILFSSEFPSERVIRISKLRCKYDFRVRKEKFWNHKNIERSRVSIASEILCGQNFEAFHSHSWRVIKTINKIKLKETNNYVTFFVLDGLKI
jgi:hypothetical protein